MESRAAAMESSRYDLAPRRSRVGSPLLFGLLVVNALLLVYEILRANDAHRWRVHLLGVPTAAAILTATALAIAYRHHLERQSAPLLRYVSRWVTMPERSLTGGGRYWQVRLSNVGNGPAVISSVDWLLDGAQSRVRGSTMDLQAFLADAGFADGRDFWVANYSPGTALARDEDRCYFECSDDVVRAVGGVAAIVRFDSVLGDHYEKRVSLAPHRGASDVVLDPTRR